MDLHFIKIIFWILNNEILEVAHMVGCIEKVKRTENLSGFDLSLVILRKDNTCVESFHVLIKQKWLKRFKIRGYR